MTDLPTSINAGRTRNDHIADHERLHRRHASAIYSADFATLQDAFTAAIGKRRPLVIEPTTHLLTHPLQLNNVVGLTVYADGAELRAAADMDVLLDIAGGGYSTFHGLYLDTAAGVTVGDMLRIRSGGGWAHHWSFYDTWIKGNYAAGIRIGVPEDAGRQCDDTLFMRAELNSTKAGSVGVYAGNGLHANNLLHKFYALTCSGHGTHFRVDATSVHIDGANFDRAALDFDIGATRFYAAHVRAEESTTFARSRGPGTYGTQAAFVDCQWYGGNADDKGRWIEWYQAGSLRLMDVQVPWATVQPVIYAQPSAPLHVIIDGLMCGADVACPHETAFDVNRNVTITTRSYTELGTDGAVKAQTIA
jgi:hypothetical protein